VVAGGVVLAVPYVIGLSATNPSHPNDPMNWLFVPGLGPWMALGSRRSSCNEVSNPDNSWCGVSDAFALMGLIFDGIVQTTGATLLIVGLAVPKKVLVRNERVAFTVIPVPSGSLLGVHGSF